MPDRSKLRFVRISCTEKYSKYKQSVNKLLNYNIPMANKMFMDHVKFMKSNVVFPIKDDPLKPLRIYQPCK